MKPQKGERGDQSAGDPLFSNTQWSVVLRAKDESTAALNTLCGKYRGPLLTWVRSRKLQFHPLDPEDLVNEFLAAKLEERFLKNITPQTGRFRTFLLTCLQNFVTSQWRKETAKIRGGGKPHVSLGETTDDGPIIEPPGLEMGPDEEFDKAWGRTILSNAIFRLEAELRAKGHLGLWAAMQPHLYEEEDAPCFGPIAESMGISRNALFTATHRIRERLKALIHEELRETVNSPAEFEEEKKRFLDLFRGPQGPS